MTLLYRCETSQGKASLIKYRNNDRYLGFYRYAKAYWFSRKRRFHPINGGRDGRLRCRRWSSERFNGLVQLLDLEMCRAELVVAVNDILQVDVASERFSS